MRGRIRLGTAALLLLGLAAFAPPQADGTAAQDRTSAQDRTARKTGRAHKTGPAAGQHDCSGGHVRAAQRHTPIRGWHMQSSRGGDGRRRRALAARLRARRVVPGQRALHRDGRASSRTAATPPTCSTRPTCRRSTSRRFRCPWWYRETIVAGAGQPTHTTLRLAGVTSRADVWLNGTRIAAASPDRTTPPRSTSASALRPGRNGLAIKVYPADANRDFTIGWIDWNPYPPDNNMGIWQDVTVHRTGQVSLARPRVRTKLASGRGADVTVKVDVANHAGTPVTAHRRGHDRGGQRSAGTCRSRPVSGARSRSPRRTPRNSGSATLTCGGRPAWAVSRCTNCG